MCHEYAANVAACSGEVEPAKVEADVVAPTVERSLDEPAEAEVTSHPLPDIFGAQVRPP